MDRVTSTPPLTRMVAVLKSAPTLPDNNTATHMVVAVLFGRVAQHTLKTQLKPFSRRLPTVFDRFSDRRDSGIARRIRHSPVFLPPCAVKKRENGENGPLSDSDPTHIALVIDTRTIRPPGEYELPRCLAVRQNQGHAHSPAVYLP